MKKYDYSKREHCFFSATDPNLPELSAANMARFLAKENELKENVANLSVIQNRISKFRWQLSKLEAFAQQRPLSEKEVETKKALENHLKTMSEKIESSNVVAKIDGIYQELKSYYHPSRPGPGC